MTKYGTIFGDNINLLNRDHIWLECLRQWLVIAGSIATIALLVVCVRRLRKFQRSWTLDSVILVLEAVKVRPPQAVCDTLPIDEHLLNVHIFCALNRRLSYLRSYAVTDPLRNLWLLHGTCTCPHRQQTIRPIVKHPTLTSFVELTWLGQASSL
mgnify:CR=1 FL=1